MKKCESCESPAARECNGRLYCYEHAVEARMLDGPLEDLRTLAATHPCSFNGAFFVVEALVRADLIVKPETGGVAIWGHYCGDSRAAPILAALTYSGSHYFGKESQAGLRVYGIQSGNDVAEILHALRISSLISFPEVAFLELQESLRMVESLEEE